MAHSEPMDVDCMDSDFDNKENTFHHNAPCTEKGYEELDVSELNMKLRYSMTPVSSPMSKSYTACPDNRYLETGDTLNCNSENATLTRSLNSTMTRNDNTVKSLKSLPLQSLRTEQFTDGNGNLSAFRQKDPTEDTNVIVTIIGTNDIDENVSLPSSSSSALHTPEATTPTKEIKDEASPIMRGLKSVLNMFRASTSPVPPMEGDNNSVKQEMLSPTNVLTNENSQPHVVASPPIAVHSSKDSNTSKRNSPYKDSIVFNDDLEKELNWKDEKTSSSPEKTLIHKLLLQNSKSPESKPVEVDMNRSNTENHYHSIVEDMDMSNNETIIQDKTMTDCNPDNHEVSVALESDGEFVDCETTLSKNESYVLDIKAIQEKFSPKHNLDETKNISCLTKNTEFLDCDSSFSNNESYVLDIKEIQEKFLSVQNLDETQHICPDDNTPTLNQSIDQNITNMTFADPDLKLDATLPSNYFDYSQATTDILYELEQLEANVPSQIDTMKPIVKHEIIPEQKDTTEEQPNTSEVMTQNITLYEKTSLDQNNENTESQENKFKIIENKFEELENTLTEKQNVEPQVILMEEQNTSIVHSITSTVSDAYESVINTVQCTKSLIESENKSLESQQKEINVIQNNAKNEGEVKEENPQHVTNSDQTLETTIIQDSHITENKNDIDMKIKSQETTSTAISESRGDIVPVEMLSVQSDCTSFDVSNVIQSEIIFEDLNSSHKDIVPSELLSVAQINVNSQMSQTLPADLSLAEDLIDPLKTVNVAQSLAETQTTEVQTENPSEIPLPDDDVDNESVLSDIHTESVPTLTSDVILTLSESKLTETELECLVENKITKDSVLSSEIENKITNDSVLSSEMSRSQLAELQTSEKTDMESPNIKALENVSKIDNNGNEELLPEVNDLSLTTDSHLRLQDPALPTADLKITVTEISKEKTPDTVSEKQIDDGNMLNKEIPLTHTTFNLSSDNVTENITEIIDESTNFTNNNTGTVITNIATDNHNTSQIEPMDITLNESFNMIQYELPDIVNQTIVLAEDNVQKLIIEDDIVINKPNELELSPNPSNVKQIENLETLKSVSEIIVISNCETDSKIDFMETLSTNANSITPEDTNLSINDKKQPASEIENVQVDNRSYCEADSKIDLMEKISANENSIIPDDNNLPINDKKLPTSGAENDQVDNEAMKLSDDQPPKVFTNTPESEPMEVEETTVDEEILVSANNSPYVSLMSSVERAPEKTVDPEKIEDAFEKIENPFVNESNASSSPPITSKGYNFNFDEIEDPFATKPKIRLSPPLDTPTKPTATDDEKNNQFKAPNERVLNRRKSQPTERRNPTALKKKINASFDGKSTPKSSENNIDNTIIKEEVTDKMEKTDETSELTQILEIATNTNIKTFDTTQTHEEKLNESNKKEIKEKGIESIGTNTSENELQASLENNLCIDSVPAIYSDIKTTSSSEQSAYYSAGGSSTESFISKNVFNLPEIDDVNFNPFATKSKMRQSPPIDIESDNPFATRSKMRQSPPPDTVNDNPFATSSKVKSSPDVSIISYSRSDTNRTVTMDESKLAQLVKNIEDEDKMETELMEKDTSANITATTSSSRDTDKQNLTTREVNTEDEDTIEGPFLEVDDDIEKVTDIAVDNEDMMQFNNHPEAAQSNEDNLDGELFIDAEAFEFLLSQNKSNVVADSGKESLFLKFDPLFAKRLSSNGVLASLNKTQKKQSTPTKTIRPSLRNEASPIAGPSALNLTYEGDNNISQEGNDDVNITVTKPTMVVTPALNPAVTPRNKTITPARTNRRSITFTSPAIAVIDRLLSMSANNSILGHDNTTTHTRSNGEQTEADLALTQLRELLAEKEISVYNLRSESKELKDRLSTMESQVRILETDGQERLKKINELNGRLVEKTKINKRMAAVVEEYERTIASLIADIEQDKKRNAEERIRLINERDEQTAHLSSMEVSFSDLHSKYEKSKQVILTCKANEDIYKKTIQEFQEQVTKMQANYEMLKQHATAKLNHANQELEKINRAHEAEVVKLNAMIKRNHLLATSLQETLAQKTKANDELTAICDELINKVGK